MEKLQINDVIEMVNNNYQNQKAKIQERKQDSKDKLLRFAVRFLFGFNIGIAMSGMMCISNFNKKKNNRINSKISSFEILEDSNLDDIKLGTLFEDYYGMDLDDEKIELLDDSKYLSYMKCAIDSYHEGIISEEDFLKIANSSNNIKAIKQANLILKKYITMDNEHACDIKFNYVEDASISACGENYYTKDETISECIKNLDYLNDRNTNLSSNTDKLNEVIDGILKLTISDIKLQERFLLPNKIKIENPSKQKSLTKKKTEGQGVTTL